jgi:NAD-dependent dihydropyrimidine dehydrogenase PreA subunit
MASNQVPREKIPWFPTVDTEKCNGCRVCFEFCQQGVYTWDEEKSVTKVTRPFNCVVGCSGCQGLCPVGAISFPDIDAIQEVIRKLREG